jgi:hypothetical protein
MVDLRADILSALRELNSTEFVAEFLFDCIPHIFSGNRAGFIEWKGQLASGLEVDPACVTLIGSSAIGISLNPEKGFKAFGEKSDVDVAIVSNYHFSVAWRFLRTNGHRRTHVDHRTRMAWDEHAKRFVYWGTIATDRLLGILPFGTPWLKTLAEMARKAPTIGRDINLRIYADYESLRAYQLQSVVRARQELLGGEQTNATIP